MSERQKCSRCGYFSNTAFDVRRVKNINNPENFICEDCNQPKTLFSKKLSRTFYFLFFGFLVFIGYASTESHGGFDELAGAVKSNWTIFSETKGVITQSSKEKHCGDSSCYYTRKIRFAYQVEGEIYSSDLVSLSSNREMLDQFLEKYTLEKEVRVFYDSENPSFATLEPNNRAYSQLYWGLGVPGIFLVLLFLLGVIQGALMRKGIDLNHINIGKNKDKV